MLPPEVIQDISGKQKRRGLNHKIERTIVMKRIHFILAIAMAISFIGATNYLQKIKTSAGARLFNVAGTDTTISKVFNTYPIMTLKGYAYDTTATDSTQLKIVLQSLAADIDAAAAWDNEDSITVSGDSAYFKWNITDDVISCTRLGRFLVIGQTGNSAIGGSNSYLDLWGAN